MNKKWLSAIMLSMTMALTFGAVACEKPNGDEPNSSVVEQECVHEWNEGEVVKEATCTEEGEKAYECGLCGEEKTEAIATLAHEYVEGVCGVCGALESEAPHVHNYNIREIESQATCKEGEKIKYSCECGEYYTIVGEAKAHAYEEESRTEATCGVAGAINYKCGICGDEYSKALEALSHEFSEKITKVATCDTAGEAKYTCILCEYSYTKVLNALGGEHEFEGKFISKPTCTTEGEMSNTCKKCGFVKFLTVMPTGHTLDEGEVVEASTCTEKGEIKYTCEDCGVSFVRDIPLIEHSYTGAVTKAATCVETGVKTFTCVCGDSYTEAIQATGHIDENNDKLCDYCGAEDVELRLMSGSDYLEVGGTYRIQGNFKNGVGLASNLNYYTLEGVEFSDSFFEAKIYAFSDYFSLLIEFADDSYVEIKTAFTLASDSSYVEFTILESEVFKGSVFNYTYAGTNYKFNGYFGIEMSEKYAIYEVLEDHKYELISQTEATCGVDGEVVYQCVGCKKEYTTVIEALQHNYTGVVTKKATCAEAGVKTFTCGLCGKSYEQAIAKTNEHLSDDNEDRVCDDCGTEFYQQYLMSETDILESGTVYRIYGDFGIHALYKGECRTKLALWNDGRVDDDYPLITYVIASATGMEISFEFDDGKIIKLDTTYTVAADYSYIEFQIEESDEFSGADFEYVYIDDHYTDPEDMERYRVDCYFSIAFESVAGYKLYSLDIHYEI